MIYIGDVSKNDFLILKELAEKRSEEYTNKFRN